MILALAALGGAVAGLAGAALTLARARHGAITVDVPDDRRLHKIPTPRGGGVGIAAAGLLAALLLLGSTGGRTVALVVLVWALPNGILGWIDDRRPMGSLLKLGAQAAAAIAAVILGLRLEALEMPPLPPFPLGWAAYPLSVLWLVWMANVYNFMDGMDALAPGCGILFFAGFGALASATGAPGLAALAAAEAGALAGFLRYNTPPARIFMGDAGSLFCGAVLGGLAVALVPAVPFATSLMLLGTFVWDATFTIVRRLLRGDPMRPHRTHLFQRLALAGWSHARVRALYFALGAALAAAALTLGRLPGRAQAAVWGAALCAMVGMVLVTRRQEARGASR